MFLLRAFKNLGMRAKLVTLMLGICCLVTLSLALVVRHNRESEESSRLEAQLKGLVDQASQFRNAAAEANLAAMDAIVDKDSGKISDDVRSGLQELVTYLEKSAVPFRQTAQEHLSLGTKVDEAITRSKELVEATQGLFTLVEQKKATDAALAQYDDAIDGASQAARQVLADVQKRATELYVKTQKQHFDAVDQQFWAEVVVNGLIIVSLMVFLWGTMEPVLGAMAASSRHLGQRTQGFQQAAQVLEGLSNDLGHMTNEQGAAVTETAAAMTQMQSVIKRNMDNLSAAADLTDRSFASSQDGVQSMERMMHAIKSMADAGGRLSDISNIMEQIEAKTQVINSIVFKTQILSFNASIEAARAGAQGKGFAIVAAEVGRLAQVSGAAAAEIDALLENSKQSVFGIVSDIEKRLGDVRKVSAVTQEKFELLSGNVRSVTEKLHDIQVGAQQQSSGVEQVARAMADLSVSAQKSNAVAQSLLDQTAHMNTGSTQLSDLSSTLNRLVFGVAPVPVTAKRTVAPGHSAKAKPHAQQGNGAPRSGTPPLGVGGVPPLDSALTPHDLINDLALKAHTLNVDHVEAPEPLGGPMAQETLGETSAHQGAQPLDPDSGKKSA